MDTRHHESPDDPPDVYEDLLDRYRRVAAIDGASGVLMWDQRVMMPEGGTPARAEQHSALSAIRHDRFRSEEFEAALDGAEAAAADLTADQAAVVRELRRRFDRQANVPGDLVDALSETKAENQTLWRNAKADDDFEAFAPGLRRVRDLQRRRAEHVAPGKPAYEVLYEDSEPYLPLSTVERILDRLKAELVPLIERVEAADREMPDPFADGGYDESSQRALSEAVLDGLGFDWTRGRLDTAEHPFTTGNQFDCRLTTRFAPDDPLDGLLATVHEYGHARYVLGLPDDEYGTPLGETLTAGVNESQARFWENHVARSRPFWEWVAPTVEAHLDGVEDLAPADAYAAVNRVHHDNPIRVDADELTYHLHVAVRCEVGRAFVEGDIAVEEIPATWNEKMAEYLGVTPATDREGCLQDVHWVGRFAVFQGYTIGSVLAAQLDAAMREDLGDVDELIRAGEFDPLAEWLEENVHAHGRRYPTDELVERATGEPLTADYFLEYVEEKYADLYDL